MAIELYFSVDVQLAFCSLCCHWSGRLGKAGKVTELEISQEEVRDLMISQRKVSEIYWF